LKCKVIPQKPFRATVSSGGFLFLKESMGSLRDISRGRSEEEIKHPDVENMTPEQIRKILLSLTAEEAERLLASLNIKIG
jgi:hypothetical protein